MKAKELARKVYAWCSYLHQEQQRQLDLCPAGIYIALLKESTVAQSSVWCGIKCLQLGRGILYRNKCCTLPTASLCLLRHRPTILLSIGGYCSCTGLKENEREKLGNSLPKRKVAGNFEVFLHVYMHVWVHQLLHKEEKKQQGRCIGRALFCVLYPSAVPGRPG